MKIKKIDRSSLILFIIPLLTIFTINIVGQLMFSDILVLLLAPILLFNKKFNKNQPYLKTIMLLLLLWILGAVISDVFNGTSLRNALRGISMIIFFGLHIFVIFILVNGYKERYYILIIGLAISFPLRWITGNSIFSSESIFSVPWKMGVGLGFTILFMSFLGYFFTSERLRGKILLLVSPIHLFLNARSLFLTTVLAASVSAFQLKIYSKKNRVIFISFVMILVIIVMPLAMTIYGNLNESGTFGKEAQQKYLEQTAGGKINILLAGRSELLVSTKAISDSPIFGHGSWAESKYYYYIYLKSLQAIGKDVNWDATRQKDTYLIPSHSILFGTWVYHGIIGVSFWVYILFLTFKAISVALTGVKPVSTRELLVVFALLWDIFFSPFGQARRCIEAVYIVVVCLLLSDLRNQNNELIKNK